MDTPIPSTGERMLGLKSRHYANMGWIGQNGPEGGGTATATATETVTDGSAIMDGNADGPEYTDGTEKRNNGRTKYYTNDLVYRQMVGSVCAMGLEGGRVFYDRGTRFSHSFLFSSFGFCHLRLQ